MGHGIWSKIKSKAKQAANAVKKFAGAVKKGVQNLYKAATSTVKKAISKVKNVVSTAKKGYNAIKTYVNSGPQQRQQMRKEAARSVGRYAEEHYPTVYERAKSSGRSSYNWSGSKSKEAGNIQNSWTASLENTIKKFCTTAEKPRKDEIRTLQDTTIRQAQLTNLSVTGAAGASLVLPAIGKAIAGAISSAATAVAGVVSLPAVAVGAIVVAVVGGGVYLVYKSATKDEDKGDEKDKGESGAKEKDKSNGKTDGKTESPEYPGSDGEKSPGENWEWRGNGEPSSGQGSWYNPKTGETLHPDVKHPEPIGPHWDYKAPDGTWYRLNPDGSLVPK